LRLSIDKQVDKGIIILIYSLKGLRNRKKTNFTLTSSIVLLALVEQGA